ncbi:SDR family oxidoreductase [Membranicola marinus]|uniref:SDR family oxidoreductase n=1 Tax=Membranihabitans marinus TaxID=1227546 RepID=A0A953HIM9_9BACT|nr:SDR family oxidoreductase [Membranihabitans marinus]MBY5956544.1 SDR family oxidoreductase [Membranihabitans marinus]
MKQIVITGGNSGIGLETARILARKGHRVTLTVRSEEKGQKALKEIHDTETDPKVDYVLLDLSDFRSMKNAAAELQAACPYLDVLIHNAGYFQSAPRKNEAGIELTLMVNHIAPFYLTHLLLPILVKSTESRVICVNSDSHFQASFDADNLNLDRRFHGLRAYARSKLANVLFTYEFERRNVYDHLSVYALHPGLVNTDIGAKHTNFFQRLIWNLRSRSGLTPREGADTSVYLATEDKENLTSGAYWHNRQRKPSSKASYHTEYARILWEKSKEWCDIDSYF